MAINNYRSRKVPLFNEFTNLGSQSGARKDPIGANIQEARREMTKTKEQLEEEKKISLSIRIKPIDVDELGIYYFRVKSQFKVWISGILGIISKVHFGQRYQKS